MSDTELDRIERHLLGIQTPLTDLEKEAARGLERAGKNRDDIALALGWTMGRVEKALVQKRPCICCGRVFASEGIFNRICIKCRKRDANKFEPEDARVLYRPKRRTETDF